MTEVTNSDTGLSISDDESVDTKDDAGSLFDENAPDDNGLVAASDLERSTLARKEDVAVQWLRRSVFLVLFSTAILVSSAVYVTNKRDQETDFQNAFEADANKVLESFNKAVERRLEAIDALSVAITASAEEQGATFPNVTVSNFETRCTGSRVLSGSPTIFYYPLVTEEARPGWEAYQIEHQGHFDKAYASEMAKIQYQDETIHRPDQRKLQDDEQSPPASKEISELTPNGTSFVTAPPNSGPYLPIWMFSPVTPTKAILNVNVLANPFFRKAMLETLRTGQAVIESATNLGENDYDYGGSPYFEMVLGMSQYRRDVKGYLNDPMSIVGYPVFDSFDLAHRKVVGVLSSNFYWRLLLAFKTKGIVCVLQNSQGQAFTYRIDERGVAYVGRGDQHDTKYDAMKMSSDVATYMSSIRSLETKSYTSVDLNSVYCNYNLTIYPSQDNEDQFVTSAPLKLAIMVLAIFSFSAVVFVFYTKAVGKRQEVVMNRAIASSAIVSSLFPVQVRDKIYQETQPSQQLATSSDWDISPRKAPRKAVTANDDAAAAVVRECIAESFESTTIMFADMVGFTKWSSGRHPVQVFELLETVYKAFDDTAVRRKVFKVETIGDCYVAVAGLPFPQEDHAVIMTKFANDCIVKMGQLTVELAASLGDDTARLSLRVGLHSGPVMGGVLRGQKSRFQLFGDTMNTASRMESNGVAGRIHVSQETANELVAKGKAGWIVARKDKISAKGKGELQTYWASPRSMASSVVSSEHAHNLTSI